MANKERDEKGRFSVQHGAYCQHFAKRYTDARTREGKQLRVVMDSLIQDLGGHENLNAAQRLLLDTIQSKLIVVLQIGKYVDQQQEIIKDGELLPVLGKSYLAYLNSLRLTLGELYKIGTTGRGRVPSIEEIIQNGSKEE